MTKVYDIFVVGGGINGTSILRDAIGRDLSVALCEQNDIGWATSSASTKLLHGGLRYLEHFEFRLVREALAEREVLFKTAPHISWRMRFVLPYKKQLRPPLVIRIGLFLYDNLSKLINIQGSKSISLKKHIAGLDLKKQGIGFEYSDLGVLDSKFCLYNTLDAKQKGAELFLRKELTSAKRVGDIWEITLKDTLDNSEQIVQAKTLINTTGPWINKVIENCIESDEKGEVRLVKGSHIVVPKIYDHDYCYILQNDDKRVVFAIPYEEEFTMIGTTDVDFDGDLQKVECSEEEQIYLCDVVSKYFNVKVKHSDIVWDFAGVRPLYSDGKNATSATRDYVTKIEKNKNGKAVLLNLFGGKITAAREIGEKVMNELADHINCSKSSWTRTKPLYGGDFEGKSFEQYLYDIKRKYSWVDHGLLKRLLRHYGTNINVILNDATKYDDLGIHFGYNLYQSEVDYLIANELVYTVEDILLRRTRLVLHLSKDQQQKLKEYVQDKLKNK